MIFTFSTHTFAQCYTTAPCTGGSALPSYSVTSGAPTWTGGTYKVGNNNLTVSGSSTTLTITNSCIEFDYAASAIGVTNGAKLILDNCILYSSSGNLWQGIKVNSSSPIASVEIKNSTIIADAEKGVWANNGSYEAKFTITNSTFCHCKYGIFTANWAAATTSTVTGTTFNGGSLVGGGNSIEGIYAKGIGTLADVFKIGSLAVYGTSTNYFTSSDKGIYAEDSYIDVQDGNFYDMTAGGYGIYSKDASGDEDALRVGLYSGSGANNYFNNCETAVYAHNDVKTYVNENNFTSTFPSGTYKMKKAVKIDNSSSVIQVHDNVIDNYEDHGVWLKDVTNPNFGEISIYNNTFHLTSGFSSTSDAMAIKVLETTPASIYLEINNNIIHAGKTGILINGANSPYGSNEVIHDNEIYFSPYSSSDFAHGIQVIHCYLSRVFRNYCEGNGAGTGDKIRGLYFDDTQWFEAKSNHAYNCSVGIYCNADVSLSLINCNMIEDCPYAGMFFNNIGGPSSTILYPNMTATGAPAGNYWLPDPTANRGAINGTTDFSSSTWNFSDNSSAEPEYFMPTPCFAPYPNGLTPTNIGGANACEGIPYARTSGDEETDVLLEDLIQAYSAYADIYGNNYQDGTLNDFYTLYSFWEKVTTNEVEPDALPGNLKHLYDFVSETNIPNLLILSHAVSAKDFDAANALLETIVSANDIEYYILRTAELYLNNLNDEGIFELNDEILPEIRSIAVLNGWDYGRGIYTARAMMDTTIEYSMPDEDEKLGILPEKEIVVYPNPAKNLITLNYFDGKPCEDIQSLEIYNLLGTVVKKVSSTTNTVDISYIPNGVYLLKIKLLEGYQFIITLEILK